MDGGCGSDFLGLYMSAVHFHNEAGVLAGENPYCQSDPLDQGDSSFAKEIREFFQKQYDALLHMDFRSKTNRKLLKLVLVNFVILVIISCFWIYGIFALILYSVLLFLFLRKYMGDLQKKYGLLLQSTNQLANGRLDVPIEGDMGLFNPVKEELKKIQTGFKKAVDEEVKNERMKTELVTNVSHDLRTPLTAIITYIDLLKMKKTRRAKRIYRGSGAKISQAEGADRRSV